MMTKEGAGEGVRPPLFELRIVCTAKGHLMRTVHGDPHPDAEFIVVPLCRCYVEPSALQGPIYGEPNALQAEIAESQQIYVPIADVRAEIAKTRAAGKLVGHMRIRVAYPSKS